MGTRRNKSKRGGTKSSYSTTRSTRSSRGISKMSAFGKELQASASKKELAKQQRTEKRHSAEIINTDFADMFRNLSTK